MWTVGVSAGGKPNPACSESYDRCWVLGPALVPGSAKGFWGWNDWVINWRGSPKASLGHLEIWRNGKLVLPKQTLSTAYDDAKAPYLKFGVCTTALSPPRHHARVSMYNRHLWNLSCCMQCLAQLSRAVSCAGVPQPVERRGTPTASQRKDIGDRLRCAESG